MFGSLRLLLFGRRRNCVSDGRNCVHKACLERIDEVRGTANHVSRSLPSAPNIGADTRGLDSAERRCIRRVHGMARFATGPEPFLRFLLLINPISGRLAGNAGGMTSSSCGRRKCRASVRKRGCPPLLDQDKERSLRNDLLRGPRAFRYSATVWSGALLATHVARRYRLTMSDRAGRRMLRKLIPDGHAPQRVLRSAGARTRVTLRSPGLELSFRPFPASDSLNKEGTLRRIKRLAASGLPLEPFVMTMFALVDDGVPNSETKLFLPDSDRPIGYMVNASEVVAYHDAYERYSYEARRSSLAINSSSIPIPTASSRAERSGVKKSSFCRITIAAKDSTRSCARYACIIKSR